MSSSIVGALNRFFDCADHPILFTGAGVSVRAGLPTWKRLVEKLSEAMQAHDPLITQVMKQCIIDGELTKAVDYFFLTSKMMDGERFELLRRIFKQYEAEKVGAVARLPFRACVTTNFDKSINDAIAAERKVAAIDYKYGDSSFNQAQWESDLYVARVHGAAEVPSSIVLSGAHFEKVLKDEVYQDFLRACFVHRNVLFLGFSFYDPAIRAIFEDIDRRFGPATPGRHMVLLPEDADPDFLRKANRLNIEVVKYSPDEGHKQLWDAIQDFKQEKQGGSMEPARPLGPAKRYLAACFARAKTQGSSRALREVVVEGIISAMLQDAAPNALSKRDIIEGVRISLGLKGKGASELVDTAVRSLLDSDLCKNIRTERPPKLAWKGERSAANSLDSAIGLLSESLRQRAYVQESWSLDSCLVEGLPSMFNHIVRVRGWDLGAAFAAGKAPDLVSVESMVDEWDFELSAFDRERLLRVLSIMLQNPTQEESRILGELGRVSFALEMAFHAPQKTFLHGAVLPHKIYFDASVLLPALVEGHPFSRVYGEAIGRLKTAAASAAFDLRLAVCNVYLNEMISHRRAAEALHQEYGDDFLKLVRMEANYHGAANTNVYLGAYASWIFENEEISFSDYLRRFAPYSSENELRKWLENRGFKVVNSFKGPRYPDIYVRLEKEYVGSLTKGKKKAVLIEHDAVQLAQLELDAARGERVLFVTADRQLREIVSKIGLTEVAEGMVSNVGLVQFIELVLGGISGSAGMTELLWSTRLSDKAIAVRSYFTNRALQEYDDGMAMTMPEIVDSYSALSIEELDKDGLDLDSDGARARANAFRRLGSLEDNYFKGMTHAVEKLRSRVDA